MQIGDYLLGRYKILDLIGMGGEATIGLALDGQTKQQVVVKMLDADPQHPHFETYAARFRRAGRLSFNHPDVVDPIAYAEGDGCCFLIMPVVEGETLEMLVKKEGGALPTDEAIRLIRALAEAIDVIHAHGVIHRDLKPANIMVFPDGHPVIIDFGICRMVDEATITEGSGLLGSVKWIAPEQLVRPTQVNESADIYSLGAVFHFMLTGRAPFDGNDRAAVIHQVQHVPPTPPSLINPGIPRHVDELCIRMLAKSPAERPQTGQEVIAAISAGNGSASGFCNSCGRQRTDHGEYCTACGANHDHANRQSTRCFVCGMAVNGEAACPGCRRPFSPAKHRFVFNSGALAGETRPIPEGICMVGRPELLPRDMRISRRQLHVACTNGSVQIQDAGGKNPTRVNGQVANQPTVLQPGDSIDIATNVATYFSE